MPIRLLFCGSFVEYSREVLQALHDDERLEIIGVVTTPPALIKDAQVPNPVHAYALSASLPVFTPETLDEAAMSKIEQQIGQVEILLTAGYGKLLPTTWLEWPSRAALNLHFSVLPAYRGANPAEWALLRNEQMTGVTLIEMSPAFDTGTMVAQAEIPITSHDTRETIYDKLYQLGGRILPSVLEQYISTTAENTEWDVANHHVTFWSPAKPQPTSPTPYAKRLTRPDGFLPWASLTAVRSGGVTTTAGLSPVMAELITEAKLHVDAHLVERMTRALAGFPSLWTIVPTSKGDRRLKIHSAHVEVSGSQRLLVLDTVQLEGQAVANWNQIKNSILE